jgi:hypothetical protein
MKFKTAVLAVMLLSTFIACDKASKKQDFDSFKGKSSEMSLEEKNIIPDDEGSGLMADSTTLPAPPPGEPEKQKQPSGTQPIPNPDWDKKIIKTADLNLEVKDYNAFYTSIKNKIKSVGGYVAQEEQQQSDYKIENTLSIKVPVDQFDNALAQLTINVEKINEKKITSQDVTAEYVDTRSRIEAKKQVRLRYMDLLKQAKNMEEVLSVQSEINDIQEEIESATGRVEYLGHSSAYSTINLTYYQVLNPTAKGNDEPNFGSKISGAFRSGTSWVGDFFIGLVSIWPLFLVIFAGVILYKRSRIKKEADLPKTA